MPSVNACKTLLPSPLKYSPSLLASPTAGHCTTSPRPHAGPGLDAIQAASPVAVTESGCFPRRPGRAAPPAAGQRTVISRQIPCGLFRSRCEEEGNPAQATQPTATAVPAIRGIPHYPVPGDRALVQRRPAARAGAGRRRFCAAARPAPRRQPAHRGLQARHLPGYAGGCAGGNRSCRGNGGCAGFRAALYSAHAQAPLDRRIFQTPSRLCRPSWFGARPALPAPRETIAEITLNLCLARSITQATEALYALQSRPPTLRH
ncbi:hypothetical protein CBM2633_B10899 [Cupriavidus taiwanensis]|uniref:Uncharacterized protein n=1 Tax=Cupriavidus taiwanensis TaxID=164546 RepID=A0A976AZN6_9BURK|nr:hypothetical protein CBM2614_B10034 [Cupriavidus taiwanensis]SOZ66130.1 hypothetical protein CBM2613_B10126 [Cupriavidus taiwanensis]SPA02562.1 hypothetical protein CBM2626_B150282 [Cupriavidus taiwanensis]SPA07431.1 hypothetical protein CBM2625_B10126 [Cupriavidus taiwanensis]SPA18669.1 hypothetical protein CBM2633_B10899 [Cupriavidus taiwanensis]